MVGDRMYAADRRVVWAGNHMVSGSAGSQRIVWTPDRGIGIYPDADDRVVIFTEEAQPNSALGQDVRLVGVSHIYGAGGTVHGTFAQLVEVQWSGRGGDADDNRDRGEWIYRPLYIHSSTAHRGWGGGSGVHVGAEPGRNGCGSEANGDIQEFGAGEGARDTPESGRNEEREGEIAAPGGIVSAYTAQPGDLAYGAYSIGNGIVYCRIHPYWGSSLFRHAFTLDQGKVIWI